MLTHSNVPKTIHEYLVIIKIVLGIIAVPSFQAYRVNQTTRNTHDETEESLQNHFLCLSAKATSGPSGQCNNSYNPQKVVMIEAQAQQEKLSPDQDGGDDIEAAARWNPLSQQPEQTLQLR